MANRRNSQPYVDADVDVEAALQAVSQIGAPPVAPVITPEVPAFVDESVPQAAPQNAPRPVRPDPSRTRTKPVTAEELRAVPQKKHFLATLDMSLIMVVGMLLAMGLMMVFSTTFDWSYQLYGSEATIFLQHVRNVGIGLVIMVLLAAIDYRIWRRFAVLILAFTISSLIAVLLFGDERFGARRAFIDGSYQPGELAELVVVLYMAAWLGAKGSKISSITYGLLPFAILVGVVGGLVLLQPDLSTAAVIFVTSGVMFFLGGANLMQLGVAGGVAGTIGWLISQRLAYAQDRVTSYISGITDLTQANYHVQQAVIAFLNGGWTGVGLGEGRQKFGFLPAPHTDSIFAVIGEELGMIGAALVVLLYVVFVIRGFRISRKAIDPFGSLLAAGLTLWVVTKALLNIAVMTAVLPSTGVPLPLISFGGSSLVVLMGGVGLLLSVARVAARNQNATDRDRRTTISATNDRGRGNRGQRVPRAGDSRGDSRKRESVPTNPHSSPSRR
ncbi:MAG: cell division protein FtsW [Burkholderiales bacterium]|nr:cell division protein FtsW [Anaerolineae bacterium]